VFRVTSRRAARGAPGARAVRTSRTPSVFDFPAGSYVGFRVGFYIGIGVVCGICFAVGFAIDFVVSFNVSFGLWFFPFPWTSARMSARRSPTSTGVGLCDSADTGGGMKATAVVGRLRGRHPRHVKATLLSSHRRFATCKKSLKISGQGVFP
jgi:hypothetical protein